MKRIEFLDGFRGIAILLVFFFHVLKRWDTLVPYTNQYSGNIIFNKGWLGVYLFFLISGFVILMTLERNKTLFSFIKNRWLRLFPAMFIATIFIYATSSFLYERPNGVPNLIDIIPGLTFIDKGIFRDILHLPVGDFEGAFWSIFVEVKFYFIFGLLYFFLGKKKSIIALFGLFLVYNLVFIINLNYTVKYLKLVELLFFKLGFSYFAWFTSGAIAYLYFIKKDLKLLIISFLIGLIAAFGLRESTNVFLFAVLLLILFLVTIEFDFLKKIIANKGFLFFGYISYPFYLVHENMSIALIIKISKFFSQIPSLMLVAISLGIATLFAYIIVKYLEPMIQKPLKLFLNRT